MFCLHITIICMSHSQTFQGHHCIDPSMHHDHSCVYLKIASCIHWKPTNGNTVFPHKIHITHFTKHCTVVLRDIFCQILHISHTTFSNYNLSDTTQQLQHIFKHILFQTAHFTYKNTFCLKPHFGHKNTFCFKQHILFNTTFWS